MFKKNKYLILSFLLLLISLDDFARNNQQESPLLVAQTSPTNNLNNNKQQEPLSLIRKEDQTLPPDAEVKKPHIPLQDQILMHFSYINADIMDIVDDLATAKDINIIPPQSGNKIEGKVTISLDYKISIDEAWNLLNTILDIAGYSIVLSDGMYKLEKNSKSITHEPVPLFIETPINQLPDSGRIRYLTYLANIKITDDPTNELITVLDQLLPKADTAPENRPYKADPTTNALLLMAQAQDIKSVMNIIQQLDKPGFQEKIEFVRLRHTYADMVANLFKDILQSPTGLSRYNLDSQKPEETYFMKSTKIIPEARQNALIIMGRAQAVNRIRSFIQQYIDVELDSGKSILHVYKLQYLEAESFAKVLDKIVKSEQPAGAAQATVQRGISIGPERFFEDVIIRPDTPPGIQQPPSTDTSKGAVPTPYFGGNKLIIAARNEDWKRIKKLIEELDIPLPTVLLEILVADLTIDDQRLLGTIFRNPAKIPFVNQAAFQSAQTGPGVIPDSWADPQTIGFNTNGTTISSDLLRQAFDANGNRVDNSTNSIASFITPGGTALSFNDSSGSTFALSQLVQLFGYNKIISNPHVIGRSNKQSEVSIGQERLVPDTGSGGVGGTILKNIKLKANLNLVITARISAANTVNLQVGIDINNFLTSDPNSATPAIQTRKLGTNANVQNGGILAIGGLIRTDDTETINKIPILGDIPIFSWFGKQRGSTVVKTSLTVFICPTIIQPRLRGGASEYTQDYLALAENYAHQTNLFDSLRDPITRWFFKPDQSSEHIVHQYLQKDVLKPDDIYDDKSYKIRRKKEVKEALQEPSIMVEKNKQELNNQLKEKVASTNNPLKNVKSHQELKAVDPRS